MAPSRDDANVLCVGSLAYASGYLFKRASNLEKEREGMNKPLIVSTLLLFAVVASAQATVERDAVVQLVSPKDGETVYMPHPHFRWQKKTGVGIEERYQIQISRDENFSSPASFASNKPWNTSSKQLQSSWP